MFDAPRGENVTSNYKLALDGSGEGVEGGDDLPVLPVGKSAPDHEAGQGERGEEEKKPNYAIQPAEPPVQHVAHPVDRGMFPVLVQLLAEPLHACRYVPVRQ